ncbi:RNA polymerase sigma-70 factor, ECF subfamily [Mariniphaga anaerophila]|uniref:RNA polymerase sigma-70 factor, ECF subfamily n=1 Tax=Mariniphaga anaerophila TaxID=1484053 RepID=A0A1M4T041_9BACT|nr:RNA polymerase sigma-70 factor [Mariniphaga anaerophila]SHE37730.1 RNA polymerase sigma-70 factor, ECF subfamily [Mariniphaga anaerophila]
MDKNEFTKIYQAYFEPLCLYAFRFFPEEGEATEIVQEVMLRIWEKRNTLPPVQSIEKYLYRSVYNGCVNRLEKLKVQNKYINYSRVRLLEIELENFDDTFYQWEIREKIDNEVKKFTPQVKKIFEMRYLDSMKYKEIANELGISERTVETHLQKATKTLREKLRKLFQ